MSELCLPPDDPAPGVEADLLASGTRVRAATPPASEVVALAPDEIGALRRGLRLLGETEAEALAERLPHAEGPLSVVSDSDVTRAVLRLAPALSAWFRARPGLVDVEAQRDGSVTAALPLVSTDGLLPWMLRLGPRVEVVEPRALRLSLAEQTRDLALRYREEPPPVD